MTSTGPGDGGSGLFRVARRFRTPGLLVAATIAYGTVGYVAIERWSVLDALYMTTTTLTTVGYREVHALSTAGRLFTISLIAFGVVSVFALVGVLAQLLVTGELGEPLRRRRMRRRIEDLSDHYVICAYGRVGRAAAQELRRQGASFVVLDIKEELVHVLDDEDVTYIIGDPTSESVLRKARIERATGLICAVDSDAANVYITLTARALNPDLFIVARASNPESVDKLERAGADRVVSPYVLSGNRMASHALRPAVVDFLEMVSIAPDLRLEEVLVGTGSPVEGRTVLEACQAQRGISILAVKRSGGDLVASPPEDLVLRSGDLVVALGSVSALGALEG